MDDLYLCGTTRCNRKDFPSALKSKQVLKKLRRGQSIFQQKNLVAAIWKDKKPVAFISTQCNATGEETVQRKRTDGSIIIAPVLPVVQLYNKFMGGVNKADQLCQYYSISRRAVEWEIDVLVWHWLLYNQCPYSYADGTKPPKHNPTCIQIALVKGLIAGFFSCKHVVSQGAVQEGHWPVKMPKGRCKICLNNKRVKFYTLGCEKCGLRVCIACFKNHTLNLWKVPHQSWWAIQISETLLLAVCI